MTPAFSGVRQAAAFAVLLLALIAAPAVMGRIGVLDRQQVYPTMPVYTGPVSHIQREIFDEHGNLDIAFVGSSFMWSAIDAPYVQRELSRVLGREASVTVLASVWPGLDRDYAFLRDLLSRRRVGLVVLQFPNRNRPTEDWAAEVNRVSDQPHVQAFRFYRVGEFNEVDRVMPSHGRAALYAGAVLGMPRHLLTLVRSNHMTRTPVESTLGARLETHGYYGAPYQKFRPNPPLIPADEMIFSAEITSHYKFFDEPLPDYQLVFAKLIASLLKQHDVPAILLHIPQANEITADTVEERVNWLDATGIRASMVGIPPARLFHGLNSAEVKHLFANDHLNDNGAIYFTKAVTPTLTRVFSKHEQAD